MADIKNERLQLEALENLFSQERFSEALNLAKKLSEEFPGSFPIKLIHVKTLKELNRLGDADEMLEELTLTYPNNLNLLAESGNLAVKRNKFDEAIEFYNKILFLDPFNSEAKEAIDKITAIKNNGFGSSSQGESERKLDFISYQSQKLNSEDTLPEFDSEKLRDYMSPGKDEEPGNEEPASEPETAVDIDITSEIGAASPEVALDFQAPAEEQLDLDINLEEPGEPPPPLFEEIPESPPSDEPGLSESPMKVDLGIEAPEAFPEPAPESPVSWDLAEEEPPMVEESPVPPANIDLGIEAPEASSESAPESPVSWDLADEENQEPPPAPTFEEIVDSSPAEPGAAEPKTPAVSFDIEDLGLDVPVPAPVSSTDWLEAPGTTESPDQAEGESELPPMWPEPDDTKIPPAPIDAGFEEPTPEPQQEPVDLEVPEAMTEITSEPQQEPVLTEPVDLEVPEAMTEDIIEESPGEPGTELYEPPEQPVEESAAEVESEIVTESAAQLYVQQGLYEDAQSIYEKLYHSEKDQRFLVKINQLKEQRLNLEKIDVLNEFLRVLQGHRKGD
ncbi:MAG: hypothetical protein GY940_23615 [bacterium]|nr:hypothetical protein [bacterium]